VALMDRLTILPPGIPRRPVGTRCRKSQIAARECLQGRATINATMQHSGAGPNAIQALTARIFLI